MSQSDRDQILELAYQMLEESPFAEFDSNDIPNLIDTCLANDCVIVSREGSNIVGFLLWIPVTYHPVLGACKLAAEIAWYVHHDYRADGHGVAMLTRYEAACREGGFTHSTASAMFNENFDKVKHLYQKLGYKMVEASFIKEVK